LQAVDLDAGENAIISYYQIGRIQQTLTEGLENVQKPPFLVNKETGAVLLNFDPQKGMKGYFDFMVSTLQGQNTSIGVLTCYRLDGPGIESRRRRDIPHLSRPVLGPTQLLVQWIPALFAGGRAAEEWH
jgi:hypothetical protein